MSDLLPCPFCGHTGLQFESGSTYRWGIASCSGCGASTGEVRRNYPDDGKWHAEAIAEWNRRAQPAQAVPASCGECGKKTSDGWALYCAACIEEAGLPGGTSSPPLTHSCTSSLVRTADSTAQAVPLLSDEEMVALWQQQGGDVVCNFGRAIEAAVRAKCGIVGKETDE